MGICTVTTYYHLQVGKPEPKPPHSLILKPGIPKYPFEDEDRGVLEDDFTPRVCLGATLETCIRGLQDNHKYYDVYETIEDIRVKKPITVAGPKYNGIGYTSKKFRFHGWLEEHGSEDLQYMDITRPSQLPSKLQKAFKYCVPDARETGELWSLNPVRVKYVGLYVKATEEFIAPDVESNRKAARAAAMELRKLLTY